MKAVKIPCMINPVYQRIRERAKLLGLTDNALSRQAGFSRDILRNLKRATPEAVPHVKTLKAIASVLHATVEELIDHVDDHVPSEVIAAGLDGPLEPGYLDYGGIVEAGAFREVDELDQRVGRKVPRMRDLRYPKARQYAFEIKGDSMNLEQMLEGMWVAAIDIGDYVDLYGDLRDGMMVVVENSEAENSRIERSVKMLMIFADRFELHPRSSNPKHKPIVIPRGEDPLSWRVTRIIALVTEIFKPVAR